LPTVPFSIVIIPLFDVSPPISVATLVFSLSKVFLFKVFLSPIFLFRGDHAPISLYVLFILSASSRAPFFTFSNAILCLCATSPLSISSISAATSPIALFSPSPHVLFFIAVLSFLFITFPCVIFKACPSPTSPFFLFTTSTFFIFILVTSSHFFPWSFSISTHAPSFTSPSATSFLFIVFAASTITAWRYATFTPFIVVPYLHVPAATLPLSPFAIFTLALCVSYLSFPSQDFAFTIVPFEAGLPFHELFSPLQPFFP